MNNSFGDVNVLDIIFKPTDILLFAEWNDRKNVQRLNDVPSPKKQTKNAGEKTNEKNDKYDIKLL